jgi:hypothetical protein
MQASDLMMPLGRNSSTRYALQKKAEQAQTEPLRFFIVAEMPCVKRL